MLYLSLALTAVALLLVWRANKKNADLKERIAQVNSRVYNTRRELNDTVRDIQAELNTLKYDLMHLRGETRITGEMTIEDITALHPQATEVLAAFHIGGCSSCSVDGSQRLDIAAAQNNQPLKPILVALNTLISTEPHQQEEMLRVSNVQLDF